MKRRVAHAKKSARRVSDPASRALSPSEKVPGWRSLDLIVRAAHGVTFVHPAIDTTIAVGSDGFHVTLNTVDRDTGDAIAIDFRWDLPTSLRSRERAIDWIYACAREAWVHELNEALFVDGARRRDLHDSQGRTIPPPDEANGGSAGEPWLD